MEPLELTALSNFMPPLSKLPKRFIACVLNIRFMFYFLFMGGRGGGVPHAEGITCLKLQTPTLSVEVLCSLFSFSKGHVNNNGLRENNFSFQVMMTTFLGFSSLRCTLATKFSRVEGFL